MHTTATGYTAPADLARYIRVIANKVERGNEATTTWARAQYGPIYADALHLFKIDGQAATFNVITREWLNNRESTLTMLNRLADGLDLLELRRAVTA